jgi:hypothetical protein
MVDFFRNHMSEIASFVGGIVGGALAGSRLTLHFMRRNVVTGSGSNVDQSGAAAGGDIIGRDKRMPGR